VIDPAQTRPRLISVLEMLPEQARPNPPRKHGNIPL
jgi:acetyl-CoA carboxylase carboxyltransferase component